MAGFCNMVDICWRNSGEFIIVCIYNARVISMNIKNGVEGKKHDFQRTIFGSFGFNPMSPNGFNPAIAPKPMWLFNCVSGSCGFCPVCIVGKGCGVELEEGEEGLEAPPAERAMPLTMWMVCEDWILYVDSGSSSCELGLVCLVICEGNTT